MYLLHSASSPVELVEWRFLDELCGLALPLMKQQLVWECYNVLSELEEYYSEYNKDHNSTEQGLHKPPLKLVHRRELY